MRWEENISHGSYTVAKPLLNPETVLANYGGTG